MSELDMKKNNKNLREHLLFGVSTLALLLSAGGVEVARGAEDADRPVVWIELGGQLERYHEAADPFSAPFGSVIPPFVTVSPSEIQRAARYANGAEGKISFEPSGTDWVFSASVRFGRSSGIKHGFQSQHVQRPETQFPSLATVAPQLAHKYYAPTRSDFFNADVRSKESHVLLDFSVGKDVGIGMFGRKSESLFSFGVRFAQFGESKTVGLQMRPDLRYSNATVLPKYVALAKWHDYELSASSTRSFHGLGPAVSWSGSVPLAGSAESLVLAADWGVNAAILFGKQKANTREITKGDYFTSARKNTFLVSYYTRPPKINSRTRSSVVPNVGGLVGMSLKFPNAKIGLGYRADFFAGAMDGGIDSRKAVDVFFHGPFATISIGLGG